MKFTSLTPICAVQSVSYTPERRVITLTSTLPSSIAAQPAVKRRKSPFRLKTQLLNLAVTGNLNDVSEFLAKLSQQEHLIHTGEFKLRKSTEDKNQVELEMDLLLFDLVPLEAKKA